MSNPNTFDEKKRLQIVAENKKAAEPVLVDLLNEGFKVDFISELYNKRINYRRAIPILLKWLPVVENPDVKEAIVRALSVSWAKHTEASKLLVREFQKQISNPLLQWAIGNALSVVADDEIRDDIVELIQEKQYGKAREMLVIALGNMRPASVEPLLLELLDDEDLAGYAIMALGKQKSQKAYPFIEKFLTHKKTWIRNEAKKALKRIGK